jgi:hypothetical protein
VTEYETYSVWIALGGIIVTFLAVVVAIWGERLRQLLSSPKLRLSLDSPALTSRNDGHQGWYYILRVDNERSSSPATNVQVLLTRVLKQTPDGDWEDQTFSGPVPVMWRWPEIQPPYETVGPDKWATFGYVIANTQRLVLQFYFSPNNLTASIPPDEPTRLEFCAVSDTGRSKPLLVQVDWDGGWAEDAVEMHNHLTVQSVPA